MPNEDPSMQNFRRRLELTPAIQLIRDSAVHKQRFLLKDLTNPALMRQKLQEQAVIEVFDGTDKTGVLINPERFHDLLEYMDLLEAQLERDSLDALLKNRKGDTNFVNGDRLKSEALDIFDRNETAIRQFLDTDTP